MRNNFPEILPGSILLTRRGMHPSAVQTLPDRGETLIQEIGIHLCNP